MKKAMTEKFTADELYVIERDADLKSATASRNIFKLAEIFMHLGVFIKDEKEQLKLRKALMKEIEEHHRSSDIYRKIRNKCEYQRKK